MNEIKSDMIRRATEKYEQIFPCSNRDDLRECFTTEGGLLMFWFNTRDQSTHVVAVALP